MEKKVVVIGASNVDVKGRTVSKSFSRTKSPGKIELSAGGVGRNIAENISRLGFSTILLSAVGSEGFSQLIIDTTEEAGVDASRILRAPGMSGIFMAIINSRGEVDSSVSDMSILSQITPTYIMDNADLFNKADYVIIDADIPEATLALCLSVTKEKSIPVCVEPVSPAKAQALMPYLGSITMTTPNREELESMVNRPLVSEEDIRCASLELLEKGVTYVVVTLGAEGVYCASHEFSGFIPSIRTMVVNSVGAGDALVAGVVSGFLKKQSFLESIKRGIACATIALMDENAVSPVISDAKITEFMEKMS